MRGRECVTQFLRGCIDLHPLAERRIDSSYNMDTYVDACLPRMLACRWQRLTCLADILWNCTFEMERLTIDVVRRWQCRPAACVRTSSRAFVSVHSSRSTVVHDVCPEHRWLDMVHACWCQSKTVRVHPLHNNCLCVHAFYCPIHAWRETFRVVVRCV